eukprot:CAMPEP_0205801268 /NCGR_PEP_ID=MMETSP0205-20121125/3201_1 /ASSEMBLY_ACC=CAM_ASM_000278 /TAXON_ID=36767 /ORGANISM="Euplotes focardii, Strain TN1" /LENGTH=139 /DNA_ID=CAMNT_0053065735 /DNA_START=86 /DNA_END=502 /DNA_ORIENTATION=-
MSKFEEEHKKAFPDMPLPKQGYPDGGNGYFYQKNTYEAWYGYNNKVRVHQNLLEQFPYYAAALLFCSFHHGIATFVVGVWIVIGRTIYTVGYVRGGGKGRLPGRLMEFAGVLALWGLTFYGIAQMFEEADASEMGRKSL